ncbi:nitroreductase family protein [Thiomicrorhabdus arctica]|jgi:hypothetical protein|uniref:hypothetical protein n=1 Tax=Thiomicrorhabdus arctica TaxID=131540 RepID=UPI0003601AF1|nr:hypothetical protein [Thiomicrorhabdus arctica]
MSQTTTELQSQILNGFKFCDASKAMNTTQKISESMNLSGKLVPLVWAALVILTRKQIYFALVNRMIATVLMHIDRCPVDGFKQKNTHEWFVVEFRADPVKYQRGYRAALGDTDNLATPKKQSSSEVVLGWF